MTGQLLSTVGHIINSSITTTTRISAKLTCDTPGTPLARGVCISEASAMRSLTLPLLILGGLILAISAGTAAMFLLKPPPVETTRPAPAPAKVEDKKPLETPKPVDRKELKKDELPEPHKADEKSKFKELTKEKTLLLETLPDGTKRLHFQTEVCLRDGVLLEVLVCKAQTKEHESILRTSLDAKLLHAGLVAIGAKPGHTVQFIDLKTMEEKYTPATGEKIKVTVNYNLQGKPFLHEAQDWIKDTKTKKPMKHGWVFAGSRFAKFPDNPDAPEYYCANNGEIIAISNYVDSMLDLPIRISDSNDELMFEAFAEKVPAAGTPVWVIMEIVKEEKK
jgi:hypothetical protein